MEQQERQRQRALHQRDGRPPQQLQQPRLPKPPKPAKPEEDEESVDGSQRSVGRQRRGRGRGARINHRNR